jgi:hypothetical protein
MTTTFNPGTTADTIYVRVYESASQETTSTCSSGAQEVTVSAAVPLIPTGLSPGSTASPGPTVTTLTPTLSWNTSTGATAYSAAISLLNGGVVYGANVTTNSAPIPAGKLNSGGTYFWTVSASNSAGSPFYTKVIAANARDATHVLDGLLYHESDLRIEEHYTDTAGFRGTQRVSSDNLARRLSRKHAVRDRAGRASRPADQNLH